MRKRSGGLRRIQFLKLLAITVQIGALVTFSSTVIYLFGGKSESQCGLSLRESFDFFCDSDVAWNRRKERFRHQQKQQNNSARWSRIQQFWQANYEPNFSCVYELRIGGASDGGKWICDPWRVAELVNPQSRVKSRKARARCLIYSIGSNNNFRFEVGIHEVLPHCEIHVFDHTVEQPRPPPYVTFHKRGLSSVDRENTSTLTTLMADLGHDTGKHFVEILKMDVEGAEYPSLTPLLESGACSNVRQLIVEMHSRPLYKLHEIHRFFELMYLNSWVIFHKEANILANGSFIEYAFIRLSWNSPALVAS